MTGRRRVQLGPVRTRRDGRVEIRLGRAHRCQLAAAACTLAACIGDEASGAVGLGEAEGADVDAVLAAAVADAHVGLRRQEDLWRLAASAVGRAHPRLDADLARSWLRALSLVAERASTTGNDVAAVALLVRDGLVDQLR